MPYFALEGLVPLNSEAPALPALSPGLERRSMNRWRDLKFVVLYHIDPLAFAKICFFVSRYGIHFKTVLCVPKKNFFSAALETRPLGQACAVGQTFCSLST